MSLLAKTGVMIPKGFALKSGEIAGWLPNSDLIEGFDVVRNTVATFINSAGLVEIAPINTPRKDFLNGGCGELLIEPQRTNLFQYSAEFNPAASSNYWSLADSATVDSNVAVAPDGTTTADRVNIAAVANSRLQTAGQITLISGEEYTVSFYLKSESGTVTGVNLIGTNFIGTNALTITEEWTRIELTADATGTFTFPQFRNANTDAKSFLVWGGQIEQGSYATSYIPTAGSTVTRNADVVSLSGASSLLGDSVGGIFLEASWFNNSAFSYISLHSSTLENDDQIAFGMRSGGTLFMSLTKDNFSEFVIEGSAASINTFYKLAGRYALNDSKVYMNGSAGESAATSTFDDGDLGEITFADGNGSSFPFYGRLRQLVIFDQAPTDTQLQSVTS